MDLPVARPRAFEPSELVGRFQHAAGAHRFRVEAFASVAGCPLIALTRRTPGPRPRIYLSAGIHGDEPAPPLALLELLEAGTFDTRADWFLCPLLNPAGFLAGSRENADRLDLNRDYRHLVSAEIRGHIGWLQRQPNFDLAICLHEDWEAAGFYLYELNPTGRASLADAMVAAAGQVCPIEQAAIIDGREAAAPGIIRPVHDPQLRDQWPEAIYLRAHHTTLSYTLESPSALPLAQRIAAIKTAVEVALQATREPRNGAR
jgi:predicted deacylase